MANAARLTRGWAAPIGRQRTAPRGRKRCIRLLVFATVVLGWSPGISRFLSNGWGGRELFSRFPGGLATAQGQALRNAEQSEEQPSATPLRAEGPQADPTDFGLVLPAAPAQAGDGRHVVATLPGRGAVVVKVHAEVGNRLVVLTPDGRLTSVLTAESTATDRPFEPVPAAALGEELVTRQFPGFKARQTRHYLYVYNTSEQFFQGTSRILESMFPSVVAFARRQKLPVHEPEVPLVLIMFRTQDEFEHYHSMPSGVLAYYNGVTNYIVLFEQSRLVDLAPELAVKQAISTIAHEGVHQILHNIGVQQRLSNWPMWLSEGLAEYFAPTTVDKRIRWKGVGLPNDLRLKELQPLLQGGPAEPLVERIVTATTLDSSGYAAAWGLTHFLAQKRRPKLLAYLADVSRRGPLEKVSAESEREMYVRHLGEPDGKFEAALLTHLRKLPFVDPVANQTHYVGMLEGGGLRRVLVTSSPAELERWQQEERATIPARLGVQAFANQALAEGFAKNWLGQ